MNVTWKQTRDLREDRLNPLPHYNLVVLTRWLISPFRILLSAYRKQHLIGFTRRILSRIVSVAAVHKAQVLGTGILAPAGIAATLSILAATRLADWDQMQFDRKKNPWSYVLESAKLS